MTQVNAFEQEHYIVINRARLAHLASLGLELKGRTVIDVGGGPGHLASFFVEQGCDVLCTDGRAENIETVRRTQPNMRSAVIDVENEDLPGVFDIVFCYGLLYHTVEAYLVLKKLVGATRDLLLLETCIMDDPRRIVETVDDPPEVISQGLRSRGCRPSPAYIIDALTALGMHVYFPVANPEHPHFQFEYIGNGDHVRNGQLMRQIFVASRTPLQNPALRQVG